LLTRFLAAIVDVFWRDYGVEVGTEKEEVHEDVDYFEEQVVLPVGGFCAGHFCKIILDTAVWLSGGCDGGRRRRWHRS